MIIGDYSAVLDACVLHPVWLKGALLWMAEEGLFRPLWSSQILDEWQNSLARRYPDLPSEKLIGQRKMMTSEFEESMVHIPKELLDFKQDILPDPKDNHVLFAAICGRADAIVTANLKDFPPNIMQEYAIEVRHPDDFLLDIITLDGKRAVAAFQNHRQSLTKSAPDAVTYVDRAKACQLLQTHAKLQDYLDVL
jgi:predicted nucleic acid-binding protein